ncbi:MFS general substrate transporter [Pseudovirgaria hyperparasitica]|uniref:MFS general substrate transporter n=1 Tax=Pseudovirgaria hyperparasitica TaxID=470096 RepID=A0A6A6WFY6_9PEZI|nr:MFS general substrate transporter [Pseudovirgaria hyperparasitica]KAF2761708.1 MFS general substrate transporter [Pseudovirgaria hyperparasitica]
MAIQTRHNGGSTTAVVELDQLPVAQHHISNTDKSSSPQSVQPIDTGSPGRVLGSSKDPNDLLPSPTTASVRLQRWNSSRVNVLRTFATFFAFLLMGANDAAYGALIPYLEAYYDLSYTVVSLIFLSPFIGYVASALSNNWIHLTFGQRGVAFLGPMSHLIAYVIIAVHPPYPVLVVVFILAGFGNGLEDAAWNAWVGNMARANEVLGLLHGFYGLGATISPLIATSMITKGKLPWYAFYYVMISLAVIELTTSLSAFWNASAEQFRAENPRTSSQGNSRLKQALLKMPAARVSWLISLFLLIYVGIEVALGGWIVTFMLNQRQGTAFASGMVATGFWLGVTVGRVVLGFVTPLIGEHTAMLVYIPITLGLELLFWLVPQFYVSAVAVSLQGFFLGPLFPAAVVAATKLLPRDLHVSTIGFAAAFGGCGACVFPFAVGAIAQARGVQVLQPIILALLATILVLWLALPRFNNKKRE